MRRFVIGFGIFTLATFAPGQSIQMQGGALNIGAGASAGSQSASDSAGGSAIFDSYYKEVVASATDYDNGATANSAANARASWENELPGAGQRIRADILGYAESYDEGLPASASAIAWLDLRFKVTSDITASIFFYDADPSVHTKLEKFDGTNWNPFLSSGGGNYFGAVGAGEYRWLASNNLSVNGTDGRLFYHALRIEDSVPEPATMAVLGLGALAVMRRRRAV